MGIRQSSISSYIIALPTLNAKQNVVFEAFLKANCRITDRDLSKFLGWSINTVTPRRGELVKMGYVEDAGLTFDYETNRRVMTWRLKRRL